MKSTRAFYDIEVYPNLLLVCFKDYETGEKHHYYVFDDIHGKQNVNQIQDLLPHIINRCQWLIGYNNWNYDDMVVKSLFLDEKILKVAEPKVITNHCRTLSHRIIESQNEDKNLPEAYTYRKVNKFESYDLIQLLNTIDRVSLKQLAINLRWHKIQDLPYPPDHIVEAHQIDEIIKYCYNDVDILKKAFEYYTPIINERIKFSKMIGIDVNNKNDTDIAKTVLATNYEKETGIPFEIFNKQRTFYDRVYLEKCISSKIKFNTRKYNKLLDKVKSIVIDPNKDESKSKKKKQFDLTFYSKYLSHTLGLGGIHSNNPSEILEDDGENEYWDLDVTSYYPRVMINDNLKPAHLDDRFLDIYDQNVVTKRVWAKKHKETVLANFLKITANGTFGLTNSKFCWMYDPYVTYSTTVNGQLYLMMLIEALEYYSRCIVVYSNTDGLTVKIPKGEKGRFKSICEHWMKATGFDLEFNRYDKMIVQDVNNYLMFTHEIVDGKHYKNKGSYSWKKPITKGYEYPIVPKAVFEYFDKGTPIENTIIDCKDIYEFLIAERTNPKTFLVTLETADGERNTLQKNNRWIITKGQPGEGKLRKQNREDFEITEMQKGRLVTVLNDIHSPLVENYKLDYEYYINQAQQLINLKPSTRPDIVDEPLVQAVLF